MGGAHPTNMSLNLTNSRRLLADLDVPVKINTDGGAGGGDIDRMIKGDFSSGGFEG